MNRSLAVCGMVSVCGAASTAGQVSDVSVRYVGNVSNVFVYNSLTDTFIDTGFNESFDIAGGAELLPFSRSAMGGSEDGDDFIGFPEENVFVSGAGAPSATGEMFFTGRASASAGVFFPNSGNFDVNAITELQFTVDGPSEFTIQVNNFFFDNDTGSAGVDLRDSNNSPVFQYFGTFFDPSATGILQAGTYTLTIDAYGSGNAGASLQVAAVPAPATAALLWLGGGLAARRRR